MIMKKNVAIGVTFLVMSFTTLGSLQEFGQVAETHNGLFAGSVSIKAMLGTTVYADTATDLQTATTAVRNLFTDETFTEIKKTSYRANIESAYLLVSELPNSSEKTKLLENIDLAWCLHPVAMQLFEKNGLPITSNNMVDIVKEIFTDTSYTKLNSGFEREKVLSLAKKFKEQYTSQYTAIAASPKFKAALNAFFYYDSFVQAGEQSGNGQAEVTYNVNKIDPDDPSANPDFTVLIPSVYELSDSNLKTAVHGEVSIKDAQDLSKDYAGDQTLNVTVTSAKMFKFDNGGEYHLVKEDGTAIADKIELNKTTNKVAVNAKLSKVGAKKASTDTLTFKYTVAPVAP